MERPRESAARNELNPGETWQAPLSMIPGAGNAAAATASSTESEVIVTFVEGGERWELRRTASLDIPGLHVRCCR